MIQYSFFWAVHGVHIFFDDQIESQLLESAWKRFAQFQLACRLPLESLRIFPRALKNNPPFVRGWKILTITEIAHTLMNHILYV